MKSWNLHDVRLAVDAGNKRLQMDTETYMKARSGICSIVKEYVIVTTVIIRWIMQDIYSVSRGRTPCTIVLDVSFAVGGLFLEMKRRIKICEGLFDGFFQRTQGGPGYAEVYFGGETGDINLQIGYEDRNEVCEKEDVLAKKNEVCKVHLA